MLSPIRLKKTVGEAYNVTAEDALTTKNALSQLGHMEIPDYGLDEFPDAPMVEAIRSFQRAQGLTEDGVMKPDGPTLERLNASLRAAPSSTETSTNKVSPEPTSPHDRHLASLPSRPGALPTRPPKDKPAAGTQVAFAPAVALIPQLIGAAARIAMGQAARTGASAAAAGAAGALLGKKGKEAYENRASSRMEPAPSFPPPPGIEPPDMPLPDRTESPNEPVEIPDLSTPLPKIDKPTIFVLPAPTPGEFGDGIVERKGNEATRKELERIRDYFEQVKGWRHVAGGRYSPLHELVRKGERKAGEEQKERHIKGHFKSLKGGHFTDLTFIDERGRTVHVQSVDVDKYGKPSHRELDNAEKIRRATENEDIFLIPKGAQLKPNRKFQR